MALHPLTVRYLSAAQLRPGMYYSDGDLAPLENQLHGFDAALAATGAMGDRSPFNPQFRILVTQTTGLSCSRGWATAMRDGYKSNEDMEHAFWQLVERYLDESNEAPAGDQN